MRGQHGNNRFHLHPPSSLTISGNAMKYSLSFMAGSRRHSRAHRAFAGPPVRSHRFCCHFLQRLFDVNVTAYHVISGLNRTTRDGTLRMLYCVYSVGSICTPSVTPSFTSCSTASVVVFMSLLTSRRSVAGMPYCRVCVTSASAPLQVSRRRQSTAPLLPAFPDSPLSAG